MSFAGYVQTMPVWLAAADLALMKSDTRKMVGNGLSDHSNQVPR